MARNKAEGAPPVEEPDLYIPSETELQTAQVGKLCSTWCLLGVCTLSKELRTAFKHQSG